jgi:hypothetical protein
MNVAMSDFHASLWYDPVKLPVFTDSIDGAASAFTVTVSPNNRLQDMNKGMKDDACDENAWIM